MPEDDDAAISAFKALLVYCFFAKVEWAGHCLDFMFMECAWNTIRWTIPKWTSPLPSSLCLPLQSLESERILIHLIDWIHSLWIEIRLFVVSLVFILNGCHQWHCSDCTSSMSLASWRQDDQASTEQMMMTKKWKDFRKCCFGARFPLKQLRFVLTEGARAGGYVPRLLRR